MSGGYQRIAAGIDLTPTQRYRVRFSRFKGKTELVRVTVDTLAEAQAVQARARTIREAGGDAKAAIDDVQPRPTISIALTVAAAVEQFIAGREERSAVSDHRRAGNHRNHDGIRPGTVATYRSNLQAMATPPIAGLLTTDVDERAIRGLVRHFAEKGYAVDTQKTLLTQLRACFGELPTAQRPADFPWKKIRPITPAKPRRKPNEPSRWGGRVGGPAPATTFEQMKVIAEHLYNCDRVVAYLMHVMGLRRGEVMGLDNLCFLERDGRLWVEVRRQRDLGTGQLVEWTKSDSSTRTLPVPHVLAEYLHMYWDRYHDGYRPQLGADHPRHAHQLCVTSTGRNVDGTFMDAHPAKFENQIRRAVVKADYVHERTGFKFKPHHLRKSCATYLLDADVIRSEIENASPEIPDLPRSTDADSRVAELEREVARLNASLAMRIAGSRVSQWLGHETSDNDDDDQAASAVTLSRYGLHRSSDDRAFVVIADFLDLVVRHEIGSLLDEPDERDSLTVISPDDPNWVPLRHAARALGVCENTLGLAINAGRYDGKLTWYADGERDAPGARYMLTRAQFDALVLRKRSISMNAAAKRLRMSVNFVYAAIGRGQLTTVLKTAGGTYLDPETVENLRCAVLETVAAHFEPGRATESWAAFNRFRKLAVPYEHEQARSMFRAGADVKAISEATGTSVAALYSTARRHRWSNPVAPDGDEAIRGLIKKVFAHPGRVTADTWNGWIADAVEAGLLVNAGGGRYTRRRDDTAAA